MSLSGTVKTFNATKGFGFITASDGTEVFCHIQACTDGGVPVQGDAVTFDLEDSTMKPGQVQACNITGGTGTPGAKGTGKQGSLSGTVKTFSEGGGFGFITGDDGSETFCHINAVIDGSVPLPGDKITYDVEESRSKPGMMTACNVAGGRGYPTKGKGKGKGGKDSWDGWGAAKGGWGDAGKGKGPYGGGWGKGDAWGCGGGWGGDAWGGAGKGWGGKGDGGAKGFGKKGDAWGGKGKGDAWGAKGGKGFKGDAWGKGAKGKW